MLLLRPGAPAQIQVAMPDPGASVPDGSTLAAELRVMNAAGTVVAAAPVTFTAPDHLLRPATIADADATAAALALAGADGRWELICTSQNQACSGTILETGPAHSAVDHRRRMRIPSGCCGGGAKQVVTVPVPMPSKDRDSHPHKFDPKRFA